MKTKKISFQNIQNVLSRAEMKKIMAGSSACLRNSYYGCGTPGNTCCSGCTCQSINNDKQCRGTCAY